MTIPIIQYDVIINSNNASVYFSNFMLDISEGFHEEDGHHLQWHLSLCLVLAWVVVFLVLFRGVSGMGKVRYCR